MIDHIYSINYNWGELPELPKLSMEDIAKVDEPVQMYLYAYYNHFGIMRKYNLNELIKTNHIGDNLLLMAAYFGNIKLIKYLIIRGINIYFKNYYNENLFLRALYNKDVNIKTLQYLESIGVNIYSLNINKANAYLAMVDKSNIKILKYLETRNFNIYLKNKYNQTAYKIAIHRNNLKIIKHLESRGFKIDSNFYISNKTIINHIKCQIKLRLNRFRMIFIFGGHI
jgi:ankyrin repeat protein